MSNYNKLLVILAVFIIFLNNSSFIKDEKNVDKSLIYNDYINWAIKNNPKLKLQNRKIEKVETELQGLELELSSRVSKEEYENKKDILKSSKNKLKQLELDILLEVNEKYYDLLKNRQMVDIKQRNLGWLKKRLEIARVKYNNGLIPAKEYQILKERVKLTEKELSVAIFKFKTAKLELNQVIGWGLDKDFDLAEKSIQVDPLDIELERSIDYALNNRYQIEAARSNIAKVEQELALKEDINASRIEILDVKYSLGKAKVDLKNIKEEIIIDIHKTYFELLDNQYLVSSKKNEYLTAKRELKILQFKYNSGMLSMLDLIKGKNNMIRSKIDWVHSIYDYNISKVEFYNIMGSKDKLLKSQIRSGYDE